jgi:hypothetical protein
VLNALIKKGKNKTTLIIEHMRNVLGTLFFIRVETKVSVSVFLRKQKLS